MITCELDMIVAYDEATRRWRAGLINAPEYQSAVHLIIDRWSVTMLELKHVAKAWNALNDSQHTAIVRVRASVPTETLKVCTLTINEQHHAFVFIELAPPRQHRYILVGRRGGLKLLNAAPRRGDRCTVLGDDALWFPTHLIDTNLIDTNLIDTKE